MTRFDPRRLELREIYQLLTRVVSPRPIAFVSTLSGEGTGNLAPFSYFNLGGINPPSLVFSVLNDRHGSEKDTLRNIRETGEFVISAVTREMAERMNLTSAAFPRGVDEFDQAGFTRAPSELVRPPRVAESPLAMECRLHAAESVLGADGRPDPERIGFIGRMGADWYVHAAPPSLFELPRPPDPPR
jgi:flavin reductase (DIM6/NTAB) family NADH-FMN oxidoreductase RutF